MVYCSFCDCYISVFTLQRFCDECSQLRRLLLLHEKDKFLQQVRDNLLKIPQQKKTDPVPAEKNTCLSSVYVDAKGKKNTSDKS